MVSEGKKIFRIKRPGAYFWTEKTKAKTYFPKIRPGVISENSGNIWGNWKQNSTLGQYYSQYLVVNISHFTTPVTYAIALMTQTASIYLTVLMTVHRFIGVCFPFKASTVLSDRSVRFAILVILSFTTIFNITKFFEVKLSDFCLAENIKVRIYELAATGIRVNKIYQTVFYGWFSALFKFIIPFAVLIIMNMKVIQAVHR